MTIKYILSYGGGVNSTAMYFVIKEQGLPLDEVVFADTGNELPETYETVDNFIMLLDIDGIEFTTVKSKVAPSLYDYCFNNKIVPSRMMRYCTDRFKQTPINAYIRTKYGKETRFKMYIGIALEEAHRMKTSPERYKDNVYPLIDQRIDRAGCISILNKHSFTNVCKSGCWFCPYTPKSGWLHLNDKHPELLRRAIKLEHNCKNKKVTLTDGGLQKKIAYWTTKRKDKEHTCDIAGGCFL